MAKPALTKRQMRDGVSKTSKRKPTKLSHSKSARLEKEREQKKEESHNGAVDTKTRQKKYFIESRTVYHH